MIVIDFPDARDCQVSLKVAGHSGKADKGYDIVCAAISALVQTFVGGVETSLDAQLNGNIGTASCNVVVIVPQGCSEKLEVICKVFKFGFRKIAESYPEHVQLN